jgi:uncharacterized membrane protein YczE
MEHKAATGHDGEVSRPIRRLSQLYAGLVLYGASMALQIHAGLGLDPWDVFHQGVADRTGLSFGTVVILTGAVVLMAWIPLRQRPGIGTVSNIVVIGLAVDAALAVLPVPAGLGARGAMLVAGVVLNGVAGAAYIGAGLGPGPRDGLMTGLVRRTGGSVRAVRSAIELGVLAAGAALGGTVGVGTVLYAVSIGPLLHGLLPLLTVRDRVDTPPSVPLAHDVHAGRAPAPDRPEALPASGRRGQRREVDEHPVVVDQLARLAVDGHHGDGDR